MCVCAYLEATAAFTGSMAAVNPTNPSLAVGLATIAGFGIGGVIVPSATIAVSLLSFSFSFAAGEDPSFETLYFNSSPSHEANLSGTKDDRLSRLTHRYGDSIDAYYPLRRGFDRLFNLPQRLYREARQ